MYSKFIFVLFTLALLAGLISAQENTITPAEDTEINANVNISWPPPVYVLRDSVDVRGTANVPNMSNYFIEFRPMEVLEEVPEEDEEVFEAPWFPVTLPSTSPVQENVLGTWNTRTTPDGLYEMRLTVNITGQPASFFIVRPVRIENNPPDFVTVNEPVGLPTLAPSPTQRVRPTLAASPTPVDATPRVTAILNANVRIGDNTSYEVIAQLLAGQAARVIGVSTSGSGWYYIELPNGDRGFIAPSTVNAAGDIGSVPRVNPPATPTPTPTNTPIPTGNLAGSPPDLTPDEPICNVPFQVLANITNTGNTATTATATVVIQDIHVGSGTVQATVIREVPPLEPGGNFVVGAELTISTFFNEEHRIVFTLDVNDAVVETNESDNVLTTTYILQRGTC